MTGDERADARADEGAPRPRVAVVGGGITGLSAAWALRQELGDAARVTVLESAARVGGKLSVHEVGGVPLDAGAEALLARRPEAVDLARAVGLADDLQPPATAGAAIWSRGRLHALPAGQVMGVPADLRELAASGLLTAAELARVPLDAWLPRTASDGDVSVGSYVGRRVGRAVVDRLVEPLLGGVYAGSADRLSLAATVPALAAAVTTERSLLAAARSVRAAGAADAGRPVFAGIRGGVGRLAAAVATASGATIRTGATVRALRRTGSGWRLEIGSAAAPEALDAEAVVLAVPAPAASRLLGSVSPAAAADLGHVDYASMALVTYVFPRDAVRRLPAGSGFLVPPVERRYVKAATFSSRKWGWARDAAPGLSVIRVSVGRHGEERDLQHDDADLALRALSDLADLVPVTGRPVDAVVTRWGGALPQYAVGHLARVARVRTTLAAALGPGPTLVLAGAAYDGVGVPACIASGTAAARAVAAVLRPRAGGTRTRGTRTRGTRTRGTMGP